MFSFWISRGFDPLTLPLPSGNGIVPQYINRLTNAWSRFEEEICQGSVPTILLPTV